MGEAKRRAKVRDDAYRHSHPIKRARFNVYAIGTRRSSLAYLCTELSWWASSNERLIAAVAIDHIDEDYFWTILARDRNGCFRCADIRTDYPSQWRAEEALRIRIAEILQTENIEAFGFQGDETNAPVDLLRLPTDFDSDKLHPYFRLLLDDPGRAPARAIIKEVGPWLVPSDPHLVAEFQTKGFDQRLWEIYLWAAFQEFALDVTLLEAPDFQCVGRGHDFTVEATTVAPSTSGALTSHPNPKTLEETAAFLDNYMPMKYGSALTAKLNKTNSTGLHYWERDESRGKPFLLAIADFHEPIEKQEIGSMTYTQSAIWQYLYGQRVYWEMQDDKLVIKPEKIEKHSYGTKIVPSGFFDLPLAANVSAVLFSNAGTMAKFDRMGAAAGFGAEEYRYIRIGLKYNPDPNAVMGTPFSVDVTDDHYEEFWTQEVQVFHNPNAAYPLPFDALPGAIHHYFEDGFLRSLTPKDSVLSSFTLLLKLRKTNQQAES